MTQREALDLLERATDDLPLDLEGVVTGGVRRGRVRRRNRRVRTTLAAAAVVGAVGLGVTLLPLGGSGGGDGSEVAVEPTVGPSQTTAPPSSAPSPRVFTAPAKDFASIVAGLAGIQDVEGPLTEPPYGVADGPDEWSAFFRLNGALTSAYVRAGDPAGNQKSCRQSFDNCRLVGEAWVGSNAGGPQDGVSYNSATAWSDGYEISVGSYNAAEGKESPVLSEGPQLTPDVLEQMVLDDVWFS